METTSNPSLALICLGLVWSGCFSVIKAFQKCPTKPGFEAVGLTGHDVTSMELAWGWEQPDLARVLQGPAIPAVRLPAPPALISCPQGAEPVLSLLHTAAWRCVFILKSCLQNSLGLFSIVRGKTKIKWKVSSLKNTKASAFALCSRAHWLLYLQRIMVTDFSSIKWLMA